jgi:hypothetical protein
MEQLMKEGLKARASNAAETLAERRKNAHKTSFGSFKRGFLNASRVKDKTTSVVEKGGTQKVRKKTINKVVKFNALLNMKKEVN